MGNLVEDEHGSLDSAPSGEPFVRLTNLISPLGRHLYGWQRYEAMLTAESANVWAAASRGTSR